MDTELLNIIKKMLSLNPAERISPREILESDVFKNI